MTTFAIVLGDINVDEYIQHLSGSTTDYGTSIDHVYSNRMCRSILVRPQGHLDFCEKASVRCSQFTYKDNMFHGSVVDFVFSVLKSSITST